MMAPRCGAVADAGSFESVRVAIVIVNWNGWKECVECIDSLFAQGHKNFRVFIVDNDSQDQSLERIAAWCDNPVAEVGWRRFAGVRRRSDSCDGTPLRYQIADDGVVALQHSIPQLTLVRSGGNLGFAGGCNVGINTAGRDSHDFFWFLNADTVVDADALTELIRRARRAAGCGMVGSTIRYYDAPELIQAMGGARIDAANGATTHVGQDTPMSRLPADGAWAEQQMHYVMGASMLVSREFIAEVGLMQEDYFLYYEDADWALRGRGKFCLGFAPRSHIFHKCGVNSHKAMPRFSSGFFYRNRLRFVRRFMPDQVPGTLWSLAEQLLRHVAKARWSDAQIVMSTLLNARKILASVPPHQ